VGFTCYGVRSRRVIPDRSAEFTGAARPRNSLRKGLHKRLAEAAATNLFSEAKHAAANVPGDPDNVQGRTSAGAVQNGERPPCPPSRIGLT